MLCSRTIYDSLVRATGKTSVATRTQLFGNVHVGWTQEANIEEPGRMVSDHGFAFTGMEVRASFSGVGGHDPVIEDFVSQRLYASLFIADMPTRESPQRVKLNQRMDFEIAPVLPARQHYYGCLEWFDIDKGDIDYFNGWGGTKQIALYFFGIDLPNLVAKGDKDKIKPIRLPYHWPKRLPSEVLPIELKGGGGTWQVHLGDFRGPVMERALDAVLAFDYVWLSGQSKEVL